MIKRFEILITPSQSKFILFIKLLSQIVPGRKTRLCPGGVGRRSRREIAIVNQLARKLPGGGAPCQPSSEVRPKKPTPIKIYTE